MNINIRLTFIATLTAILFLASCQEEVIEISEPQNDSVINSQSSVAKLVQNTTMSDGSKDNILDKSSCSSVVLPVTVIANNQEILISTEADFKLVERIFDESEFDDDDLDFIFPITVILADHSEVIITNEDNLEDLLEDCLEGGVDDDIECIDFNYPLNISVYDAANQVSDVITIDNDEALFILFESLEEDELVSFIYPITLVLTDGTEILVSDNEELEDIIKEASDDCDEDDDNDYSEDDVDDTDLVAVLLDGEWAITYFFDKDDETTSFQDFIFTFFTDGSAKASKGALLIEGTWETYGDDGTLEIEINFGSEAPLNDLNDDWTVIEFDQDKIKLKDGSGDDDDEFLTFERPSGNGGGNEATLPQVIIDGKWLVASYKDANVDETTNYNGFEFTYSEAGTVAATNNTDTINGTWVEVKEGDTHKLELDFGSTQPFDEFMEDWDVVSFTASRIELKDISGGDGSTKILVFEKL